MAPQKGKLATKGQKQIVEENKQTIKFYTYMGGGASDVEGCQSSEMQRFVNGSMLSHQLLLFLGQFWLTFMVYVGAGYSSLCGIRSVSDIYGQGVVFRNRPVDGWWSGSQHGIGCCRTREGSNHLNCYLPSSVINNQLFLVVVVVGSCPCRLPVMDQCAGAMVFPISS